MKPLSFFRSPTLWLIILFVTNSLSSLAQSSRSIHFEELKKYNSMNISGEKAWDEYHGFSAEVQSKKFKPQYSLQKEVLGWHPYWQGSAYLNYNYSLLSEISYFSFEVDVHTGKSVTMHEWMTTSLVDEAKNNGVKVSLTVTLFDDHEILLNNAALMDTLIETLIKTVQARNGDGVNIDFEAVPSTLRENLTYFMEKLCGRFHQEIPGSRVSIDLPAVDWGGTFNVAAMNNYVDLFLIMGYGYHWSGSDQAGPVAPKNYGSIWSNRSVVRSINDYLKAGISPEKLCLGVPYYGREWQTASNAIPSSALSSGASVTYSKAAQNYQNSKPYIWDDHSLTPAFVYQDNQNNWYQCWIDDATSLGYKYDHANLMELAGIGIWAMGYEGNYTHLSNAIVEKLTDADKTITSGKFYDTGGPHGLYYNNEDWTYTSIAPPGERIQLLMEQLSLEGGADSLIIYDGATPSSPLLKQYSGNISSTDTLISQSNALCFKFTSDGQYTFKGWESSWEVFTDTVGIAQNAFRELKVFPNPFAEEINIRFQSNKMQTSEIFIVGSSGQLFFHQQVMIKNGDNRFSIYPGQLKTGGYILGVEFQGKYITKKILAW